MTELFKKKKLEILVEGALAPRVLELAESKGATGYTVFPALYGKGRRGGTWQRDDLTPALGQVRVMIIAGEEQALEIAEAARELLGPYRAIILIGDVEVFRDDHF